MACKRRLKLADSNILELGYDPETREMEVLFGTSPDLVYTYRQVSVTTFTDLISADSVGKFFANVIRKNPTAYPFTKTTLTTVPAITPKES